MSRTPIAAASAALALAACATVPEPDADDPFADVEITPEDLGDGLYMLTGQGGNIGVSVGDDGVFLIDDQFAPLAPKIAAAIDALGGGDVRFLLNTHYHGDHTGGNAAFGRGGATIVAHDNVRTRLVAAASAPPREGEPEPLPPEGWPLVTFAESVTFHMNGETVHVAHLPSAHTDGDSVVVFEEPRVVHMGDVFFNGAFPFIDVDGGGSLDGYIAAQTVALEHMPADATVIPGHGPLASRADFEATRDALVEFRERLEPLAASDMTLEEIVAAEPLADYESWGAGFISTEAFITMAVSQLRGE